MIGGPAEAVYGPMLIGLVFNILLYGTMLAQVYIYFTTYKKDRTWMKTLVILLLIIDTFNSVMDTIFVYDGLVTHFGDIQYIGLANWYLAADPVTTGVVGVIVQLFYAWRIYVLIQSWILVLLVVSVSLAGGIGATYITFKVTVTPDYTQWGAWHGIDVIWLGCAGAADILITMSLVWYLRGHKTGFKNSDMVVDRIIRITMQTGLLTSMVAITNLAVFIGDPTGTHLIVNTPLCKLYTNSLMSSLNARGGWKFDQSKDTPSNTHSTGVTSYHTNSTSGVRSVGETSKTSAGFVSRMMPKSLSKGPASTQSEVFVHVESHEMQDTILPIATKRPSMNRRDHETDGDASSIEDGLDLRYPARRKGDEV
ncbi:hypothetical protein P691DRAFT_802142 [Macrolepiota fuliginosa MF-IS2]|uniref:DUF6534 domain-containing protein n=1 Tax=Macrolepiota fuliginosa MF-IS2 TaxID=1400762 RepID=A0A9P5XC64_9AGAR|nr:hypothetical protein P691DRAFT_802142 [Macrolepiota fuliginosa MF-IS2]